MVALFQFQKDAVDNLLEEVRYKNQITLKSLTGSGKTIILAHFINDYQNLVDDTIRFIWLCLGNGELEQIKKKNPSHRGFRNIRNCLKIKCNSWVKTPNLFMMELPYK